MGNLKERTSGTQAVFEVGVGGGGPQIMSVTIKKKAFN